MSNSRKTTSLEASFVDAFEAYAGTQPPRNPSAPVNGLAPLNAMQGFRRRAIERFQELGIPSRKNEAWKYTHIPEALARGFAVSVGDSTPDPEAAETVQCALAGLDAHIVVLVNGRFAGEHSLIGSLPEGVAISGLETASSTHPDILHRHFGHYAAWEEESFTALNTAFASDGLFVYVPKGKIIEKPIHVINLQKTNERLFLQPRHLLVFEENTQAKIIDTSCTLTSDATFTNAVTEAFVGERAIVEMYLVQDPGNDNTVVSTTHVYQETASSFTATTVTLTGAVVRNNLNVLPNAPHCETHLYGLFLPGSNTQVDNHTLVDHA